MKKLKKVIAVTGLALGTAASMNASATLYNISGVVVNLPTRPAANNPVQLTGSFANVTQSLSGSTYTQGQGTFFNNGATLTGSGDLVTLGAVGQTQAIGCALTTFIANPYCNIYFTFSNFTLESSTVIGSFKNGNFNPTGVEYYYSGGTVAVNIDRTNDGMRNGTPWLTATGVNNFVVTDPPPNLASLAANISFTLNSAQGNAAFNINGGDAQGDFATSSAIDFYTQINFLNANAATTCSFVAGSTSASASQTCVGGSGTLSTIFATNAIPYTPPTPTTPPTTPVPSPASLALFGLALLGMGLSTRRRNA